MISQRYFGSTTNSTNGLGDPIHHHRACMQHDVVRLCMPRNLSSHHAIAMAGQGTRILFALIGSVAALCGANNKYG